ncbi:hypothetical protein [Meridianimarinicoccus sp. MJW13]|uniref:hypothetical protein n=1 Tax=Meridianimarinicoccus sp. MJW13 TaxID=2720031 RepID=UPI0018690287|nr:hypothetical protein [Fluviibacterium sp. MJW13]
MPQFLRPAGGRILSSLAAGLLALTVGGQAARAGTLTVMGDVNAGVEANQPMFDNLLGRGNTVVIARERAQLGRLQDHINAQPGQTATVVAGPVTSALLSGVDLLILTAFYNGALVYALPEQEAIRDFLFDTGNVIVVAEASNATVLTGYNALLAGIGATISYTGARYDDFGTATGLPNLPVTQGVTGFALNRYNGLSGGTAVVRTVLGTAVAQQRLGITAPVPLPPTLLGLGGALALLWPLGWFRRMGGTMRGKR